MAGSINVNQNNNNVDIQDQNGRLTITDNNAGTTINVTQPVSSIVTVSAIGPQGPVGPIQTSGSFTGSFSGSFTGSLQGTASNAVSASYALTASYVENAQTASYVLQAVSASYAQTASYALNVNPSATASYAINALSASYALTASYIQNAQTASYVQNAQTASYVLQAVSASFATSASQAQSSISASYALSSSYAVSASQAQSSVSSSYALNATNALTASYLNTLNQDLTFNGNLTLNGTASISTLVVNQTVLSTGSNQLGDAANDTQTLWGTVDVKTGPLLVTGSVQSTGGFTGSFSGSVAAPGSDTQIVYNNGGVLGANSGFVYNGSNIGIGTIPSSYRLDISGSLRIRPANTTAVISFENLGSAQSRLISDSNFAIWNSGSETVRFLNGGNIGIGASSPTSRLQVRGSGTTSATTALRVENTNASASLVVLDNGFVGINTGSAAFNLDVNGTARINVGASSSIVFGKNITFPNVPSISMNGSLSDTLMAGFFADALNFYINSPNRIIIRGSGLANNSSFVFSNGAMGQGYGNYDTNPSSTNGIYAAGKIGVGTNAPATSAKMQIDSTTQGFLPPRTNLTSNISTPAQGLITYITSSTTEGLYYYNSGSTPGWRQVADTTFVSASLSGSAGYVPVFTGANSVSSSVIFQSGSNVGIGTVTPTALLDVSGSARVSGTTSITPPSVTGADTTTSLDIQQTWNTTGTPSAIKLNITDTASNGSSFLLDLRVANAPLFGVTKGGFIAFGSAFGSTGALIGSIGGALSLYHKNTTAAAYGFEFRPNGGSMTATSSESGLITIRQTFAPTSGNGVFNTINLSSNIIINQTGGANGITRGLFINPTLTAAADFRAIETVTGNNLLNSTSGNTYIGLSANTGTSRLQVRGSGATSATTALRVENTNASASLVITDDGASTFTAQSNATPITITGYVATGSATQPALDITGNWNTAGAPTAIKLNVTNTTSSASSLLMDLQVGGVQRFKVGLNGNIILGSDNFASIDRSNDGNTQSVNGRGLRFFNSVGNNPIGGGSGFYFRSINSGFQSVTSGEYNNASFFQNFSPTSGTATFNQIQLLQTINQTGGASGITRGLLVSPTLTAAADWRSIEWSNNTGFGLYGSGSANNVLLGNTGIGLLTSPSSRLQVRGSGTTSATTALRIENTNASASLVVLDNGFVGIGTTNPNTALEISAANGRLRFTNTAGGGQNFSIGPSILGVSNDGFSIRDLTNSVDRIVIGSTGNVGIGTTTPAASLHISGAASSTLLIVTSSAATALFVSGSGRVGIGTSTPQEALEVNGSILIDGSSDFRLKLGASIGQIFSMGTVWNGTYDTMFIDYSTLGSPRIMTLQGNGSVIVGATSSLARFHVKGAGATSATTTLRIENSSTLPSLTITDDLNSQFYGNVGVRRAATASLDIAGTTRLSGSFNTAASGSILTVIGSGSAQPIFTVQGSQGELFSITDSLTGSLFSVNDISGLPILEVFSDNTTLIGNYQDPMLITTAKVVQTNSGSFTVYSLPTASYDTAFFEYSIRSGSNARAGTIMAMQLGSTVNFTETTTTDFGSTSAVSFTVIVTGSNMALTGSSTTGSWTIKTIVRGL